MASYGSPTVVLHCSLVFLGVGGKDRNCIDSTPPLPILLPLPSLLLPPPPCPGGTVAILTWSLRHKHQSATPPPLLSRPSSGCLPHDSLFFFASVLLGHPGDELCQQYRIATWAPFFRVGKERITLSSCCFLPSLCSFPPLFFSFSWSLLFPRFDCLLIAHLFVFLLPPPPPSPLPVPTRCAPFVNGGVGTDWPRVAVAGSVAGKCMTC